MAVHYYCIPEKKKTVAILKDTRFDAINKIYKMLGTTDVLFDADRYMMSDTFRAVVVCHPDDEYNEEEGKRRAKKKLLDKYYEEMDKRINKFTEQLIAATNIFV